MTIAKDQLLEIMRSRFDYYSARAVLERALLETELEDKDSYRKAEVARIAETLASIESRMDLVVERIAALISGATPSAPPEPPEPEAPVAASGAKPEREVEKPDVTITLSGVDIPDGGEALVCGGCAALGNWEPEGAAAMTREGDRWKLSLDLDRGAKVELKFLRRDAEGDITWEAGDNRLLEVGDDGASLDAEWHADQP
jgi:hypothetical protein